MCLSCVCGLLCKLISLAISLIFIIAIVLLILWATGVIFVSDSNSSSDISNSVRHAMRLGVGGN